MIRDEDLRSSLDYSEGQKAAAHRVLVELVNLFYEYRDDIRIVGGWVPDLMFPGEGHVGSVDVDRGYAELRGDLRRDSLGHAGRAAEYHVNLVHFCCFPFFFVQPALFREIMLMKSSTPLADWSAALASSSAEA